MPGRSRRTSRLAGIALAVALTVGALSYVAHGAPDGQDVLRVQGAIQVPLADLKDGDLIFRTGRDLMARVVLAQGDEARYSHVGIVTMQGRDAFVVHAMPDEDARPGGVRKEHLAEFYAPSKASAVAVYRVEGLSEAERHAIADHALGQIGKPFDDNFRYSDDSSLYCTELVLKSLAAGKADLAPATETVQVLTIDESVYPPDALRRSGKLVEVLSIPVSG